MKNVETGLLDQTVPFIRGGSGSRDAVVFFGVNALLKRLDQVSDPSRYARQVAKLLPGYRFTILGYASSTFDEITSDVAKAIRTPPHLVLGISFGGMAALRFAAAHPELVKRLVLLVSAHRFSDSGLQRVHRQMELLKRGDLHGMVRENAALFRRPWYNWMVRLKLWKDAGHITREFREAKTILRDYHQLFGPGLPINAACAQRITAPTLIIGGAADQFFDRKAIEETAALIHGAQIRLFANETHMLPVEKADQVARAIAEFTASSG